MLDGQFGPICPLFTSASVVTDLRDSKRASGSAVMAVDSRWTLDSVVKLLKDIGRAPAGTALLPMICKVWSPFRLPISFGIDDGTPGNVNCLTMPR